MPTKTTTKPTRNVALAKAIAADGAFLYVVAGRAEVNPRLLTRIVQGREQASPDVRARLAKVLKVPEHEIFED